MVRGESDSGLMGCIMLWPVYQVWVEVHLGLKRTYALTDKQTHQLFSSRVLVDVLD